MQNLVYTSKNVHGQVLPGTAEADISDDDRGTGTDADAGINPPGWQGGAAPYYQNRSHLIAKSIGGNGRDARNLVTLTDGTNGSIMGEIERVAREILDAGAGQTFHYKAEAMYDDAAYPASGNQYAVFPMPSSITVTISSLDRTALYTHPFLNGVLNRHILFSSKPMNKQEIYNQLKAGISYPEAKGYSILTLKELLSDLQATNYKWLTYSPADEGCWSARINGKSWGTGLNSTQPGNDEAYTQTLVELSQSIQAANRVSMLVDPYTPEAVESLIMRVSEAIEAASKLPYMLRDLNRVPTLPLLKTEETSVNFRVTNSTTSNKTILAYQKDTNDLTVKDYYIGAWQSKNIAPQTNLDFIIPVELSVVAVDNLPSASNPTNPVPAKYGQQFIIDDSSGAMTLKKEGSAAKNTIYVLNDENSKKPYGAGIYKNDRFVVGFDKINPNTGASFSIEPKIYLSFAFAYQKGQIFEAVLLANKAYPFELQNHPNIIVELNEDSKTHKIYFGDPQYPDQIPRFMPDYD